MYEDSEEFQDNANEIISRWRNSEEEFEIEHFEKEYFNQQKEQRGREKKAIDAKIQALKIEKGNLTKSKDAIQTKIYKSFGQIFKQSELTNTKEIEDIIRKSSNFSGQSKNKICISSFISDVHDAFKEETSELSKRLISKLHIDYRTCQNNCDYNDQTAIHKITLGKSKNYTNGKISADGQIISARKEDSSVYGVIFDVRKDGTQLNAIQHELIHFKDRITGTLQSNIKQKVSELGILDKIKDKLKTKNKTISNVTDDTMLKLFDGIYDNSHEMMGMYGILAHKGRFYFNPLNEALATSTKDVFFTTEKRQSYTHSSCWPRGGCCNQRISQKA